MCEGRKCLDFSIVIDNRSALVLVFFSFLSILFSGGKFVHGETKRSDAIITASNGTPCMMNKWEILIKGGTFFVSLTRLNISINFYVGEMKKPTEAQFWKNRLTKNLNETGACSMGWTGDWILSRGRNWKAFFFWFREQTAGEQDEWWWLIWREIAVHI